MTEIAIQFFYAFVGAVFGLILSLFVQPLLQDRAEVGLLSIISKVWLRRQKGLSGQWMSIWFTDGNLPNRNPEMSIKLSTVGRRVAGKFEWRGHRYWLIGRRDTDEFISGTYVDESVGLTFHGAFQLRIMPNEETMVGRWMGFNSESKIVEGEWHWRRVSATKYPFEYGSNQ
jgi:hypothetical protein